MSDLPPGVVGVIVGPTGHEMGHAACWDRGGAGGLTSEEFQSHHVRRRLAKAMLDACCHHDVSAVIDGYQAERIVDKLCQEKGWSVHIIPINHKQEK